MIKKISLFGYGKTTKAIAKYLKNKNIDPIFFEDIEKEYIDKEGFLHKPFDKFNPSFSQLEIPSPGIPPSNPVIKKAKNLISEYDLFLRHQHSKPFTIWISGTNGKTTTTQMITHLLKKRGAVSGGNIGTPLAKLDKNAKIWVLETSSFTLHYTKYAKPDIYILLPVSEDHITWHGGFDKYKEAKLKPLKNLKEGEICIIPKEFEKEKTNGFKIVYENTKDLALYFGIDTKKIVFREPFLFDAVLALGVEKIVFNKIDYEKINSFKLDPHKLEEFFDKNKRLWVDDSKATNIDAAIAAISRYKDKKIHLVLGGDAKGADLKPLFEFIKDFNITIYAIGKEEKNIKDLSKKYNIEFYGCRSLKKAVEKINKNLKIDEVALLSPACASLDHFSSYKERGEKFKEYVLRFI